MIIVENLVKRFSDRSRGEVVAVNKLSFNVRGGEVYGLLGPNGAGKTTTLRIVATLTEPDEGTVRIAGVDRSVDPLGVRKKMAYVPAESGLPERLTPFEVVSMFAAIQGVPNASSVADELLKTLGAGEYAHTQCMGLSTGMKRRVVLARALVHEPEVLLLDEPTDGLDVQGRRDVLDLVRDQARLGRAIVISSHIMGEVEKVIDRIGVMAKGRMVAQGTLSEVLSQAGETDLDDAFIALTSE